MHSRSKSTIELMESLSGSGVADIGLEGQYAQTCDHLNTQYVNMILGRHLIYKQVDARLSTSLLSKNILTSTKPRPIDYHEGHPEAEYEKKLKNLLEFIRAKGQQMPTLTYYAVIERIVDEFRPAVFLELFHNNLRRVIREFGRYLISDFCHMRLIGSIQQFKMLLNSSTDTETLAMKLRKFFIPVLTFITNTEEIELEACKMIKKLLRDNKVIQILDTVPCERDEIPIGIDQEQIPSLMDFSKEIPFLETEDLIKLKEKEPLTRPGSNNEKTVKELSMRRCCSTENLHSLFVPPTPDEETALVYLTADSSLINKEALKIGLNDKIELRFRETEMETEPEEVKIESPTSGLSPTRSPADKSGLLPSFISGIIPLKSFSLDSEELDLIPRLNQEQLALKTEDSMKNRGDFLDLVKMETILPSGKDWKILHREECLTLIGKRLQSKTLYIFKTYGFLQFHSLDVYKAIVKRKYRENWDQVFRPYWVSEKDRKSPTILIKAKSRMDIFPRDFLIRQSHVRNFPSEGVHIVYFNSVEHKDCPLMPDYIRGKIHSGGIVIRTVNQNQSIVNFILKAELGTVLPYSILFEFYSDLIIRWYTHLANGCELVE